MQIEFWLINFNIHISILVLHLYQFTTSCGRNKGNNESLNEKYHFSQQKD